MSIPKISRKAKPKKKKVSTLLVKTIDTLFSKVVRTVYPSFCHACKKPLEYSTLQAAHFVGRACYGYRWDIRNVLPACRACNFYDQTHVIELAKMIDKYYGEGVSEEIHSNRHLVKSLSKLQKEELMVILKEALITGDRKTLLKQYLCIVF